MRDMKDWVIRGISDDDGRFVEVCYPETRPAIAIQIPCDQIDNFISLLKGAKRQAEKL